MRLSRSARNACFSERTWFSATMKVTIVIATARIGIRRRLSFISSPLSFREPGKGRTVPKTRMHKSKAYNEAGVF